MRINLDDDIALKLTEGDPGAMRVCSEILSYARQIDSDALGRGAAYLLELDDAEIYEYRIWVLYREVAKRSLVKMLALLRAHHYGLLASKELHRLIDTSGRSMKLEPLLDEIKQKLPCFNWDWAPRTIGGR